KSCARKASSPSATTSRSSETSRRASRNPETLRGERLLPPTKKPGLRQASSHQQKKPGLHRAFFLEPWFREPRLARVVFDDVLFGQLHGDLVAQGLRDEAAFHLDLVHFVVLGHH